MTLQQAAGNYQVQRSRIVNLNKCPAAKAAMVVDRRDPEGSGGGSLGGHILLLLAVRSYPVSEQPAHCWRHAEIAAFQPECHVSTDLIDEFVLFEAVLRPFGIECQLFCPLLTGLSNGDKVGPYTAAALYFVGDALVGELEMANRLAERGI